MGRIAKLSTMALIFIFALSATFPVSAQEEYRVDVFLDGVEKASFTLDDLRAFPQAGWELPGKADQPEGPLVIDVLAEAGITSGEKVTIYGQGEYTLRWCEVADRSLNVILDFTQRDTIKLMAPFMKAWVRDVNKIEVSTEPVEPCKPVIQRVIVTPLEAEVGEVFTVSANVEDSLCIMNLTASIKKVGEGEGRELVLVDPDFDGIFEGTWDSSGTSIGTYAVGIKGTNFRSEHCAGEVTNLASEQTITLFKKLATTLAIDSTPTATVGESVVIRATLRDENGNAIGGENIDFYVNAAKIGSMVTGSSGSASVTYVPSQAGTLEIEVSFGGSFHYLGSSSTMTLSVEASTPTTTTTPPPTTTATTTSPPMTTATTTPPSITATITEPPPSTPPSTSQLEEGEFPWVWTFLGIVALMAIVASSIVYLKRKK